MSGMKHHAGGKCGHCDGGQVDDQEAELSDDLEFPLTDCPECGGTDTATWCWREDDIGHCSLCQEGKLTEAELRKTPEQPVCMWGEDGDHQWVCAPCAKKLHAELCGCGEPSWRVEP